MDDTTNRGLVIKMAHKNKETQTCKLGGGDWFNPAANVAGHEPSLIQSNPAISRISWQFFKDREEELYFYACQLKGIRVQRSDGEASNESIESGGSEEEPPTAKIKNTPHYRYTLDEMKSYNPYGLTYNKKTIRQEDFKSMSVFY